MKQLVMDWDTPTKRIKRTWVWECNNCPTKLISDKLPEGWVEEKELISCEECGA